MMLGNNIEAVTIEGLDVTVTATETPRTGEHRAGLARRHRPRPGRTVPLKVLTRSCRGEEKISTLPIEIPANAPKEIAVLVTDGRQLNAMEQRVSCADRCSRRRSPSWFAC